jgi:hypothetical protein
MSYLLAQDAQRLSHEWACLLSIQLGHLVHLLQRRHKTAAAKQTRVVNRKHQVAVNGWPTGLAYHLGYSVEDMHTPEAISMLETKRRVVPPSGALLPAARPLP